MVKNIWYRVYAASFMKDMAIYDDVKLFVKCKPNRGFVWVLEWKDADENPYKISANSHDLLFKKAVGMHLSKSI